MLSHIRSPNCSINSDMRTSETAFMTGQFRIMYRARDGDDQTPGSVMTAVAVLWKIWPVIREVFKATRKKSDGGKRITKAERQAIIGAALPKIGAILERELG